LKYRPSPYIAALTAVLLWGVSFVASKAALRDISPITLLFSRFAIGTLILSGMVRLHGHSLLPPRDTWPALALMGFVGVFAHHLLQASGLMLTTAMNTGWLIGVIPIWSAVLSAILLKERFGGLKIAGLIGGLLGVLLVITKGHFSNDFIQLPSTRGDFLIVLSTFTWAIYSIIGHDVLKRLGPTRATAGSMLFGWLMLSPLFIAAQGWHQWANLRGTGWIAILFLGIGCSAVGYLAWYGALERIEVTRVAAFLYIEPLVTLVAAAILLHEQITPITIIVGLIVLLSVFIIQHAPS